MRVSIKEKVKYKFRNLLQYSVSKCFSFTAVEIHEMYLKWAKFKAVFSILAGTTVLKYDTTLKGRNLQNFFRFSFEIVKFVRS
jgi:hypothetical protein